MADKRPLLIGIAGGSGSGKTTFLKALFDSFDDGELALVSQDNYYRPIHEQRKDENGEVNFDLPTSIDRDHFYHDIQELIRGNSITKIEYTFNNSARTPQEIIVESAPVIITEGLFVFHYDEIRNDLDYKVFLDADHEIRLKRRIRRDSEERGYPEDVVTYQWQNHVLPAEKAYLDPFRPEVDLLIDNSISFESGLSTLKQIISRHLNSIR